MTDIRPNPSPARPALDGATAARFQALRQLGARAHQLRAATHAADYFIALGVAEDRDTGSWLMSCAVGLSGELAVDVDGIARSLKEVPAEAAFSHAVQKLRARAHQLHAAARAADHFLDQETNEDRETGSWLIACARGLAQRLAAEIDDVAGSPKRPPADAAVDANDAAQVRRAVQAPVRGVA